MIVIAGNTTLNYPNTNSVITGATQRTHVGVRNQVIKNMKSEQKNSLSFHMANGLTANTVTKFKCQQLPEYTSKHKSSFEHKRIKSQIEG